MTIDATKPIDQVLVSDLPTYIRETRTEVNSISALSSVGVTVLSILGGTTSLDIDTDLGTYGVELIKASAVAPVTLASITGGTEGQIKVFVFQDGNITITDGVKSDGKFYLNHTPALSDYSPAQDDILAIANIGGDGAAVNGYWKELFRTTSVK